MKTKKYQLVNSYFKVNNMLGLPDSILEIGQYEKEHGELPFAYSGTNWVYDAFCEHQKRYGVENSQYLTPDDTVYRMVSLAGKYFKENDILEPCCGTGQITKELIKGGYNVVAFDNDPSMVDICEIVSNFGDEGLMCCDFKDYDFKYTHNQQIIANPPYEIPVLTEFMQWILSVQTCGGLSILLLPKGFIFKDKPKVLTNILNKFYLIYREGMQEEFARTKTRAEIVVLEKIIV
ncbi:hypothetical protein FACS1894195_0460 [Bacteroidia bacterium]|nr:hypothetical protein FACS1894195_0460 [Bacteroidia bacterium]